MVIWITYIYKFVLTCASYSKHNFEDLSASPQIGDTSSNCWCAFKCRSLHWYIYARVLTRASYSVWEQFLTHCTHLINCINNPPLALRYNGIDCLKSVPTLITLVCNNHTIGKNMSKLNVCLYMYFSFSGLIVTV